LTNVAFNDSGVAQQAHVFAGETHSAAAGMPLDTMRANATRESAF
jgi:hypothetical protein